MSCLRLLKRFYDLFDILDEDYQHKKKILEDTFITVLESLSLFENIKKHRPACVMYYHLINSTKIRAEFKQKLKNSKNLDILRFNPHFSAMFEPTLEIEQ